MNITGYGVLEVASGRPKVCEAGVVRSTRGKPIETRLAELHDGLVEVIETFRPSEMALEQLFSNYKHPRTAILMGHGRGVFCLAAAKADIPVTHYAATQIKRLLTGSGRASKEQVQQAVQRELRLTTVPEPADVADALAIALAHYYLRS